MADDYGKVIAEVMIGDVKEVLDAGYTVPEAAEKLNVPVELVEASQIVIDAGIKAGLI